MTRNSRRDREALERVTVSWYCSACGKSIEILDEARFGQDRRAHLERHQLNR